MKKKADVIELCKQVCQDCTDDHRQAFALIGQELERLRKIEATAKAWQEEATRILNDYLADKDTLTLHFQRMEALLISIRIERVDGWKLIGGE